MKEKTLTVTIGNGTYAFAVSQIVGVTSISNSAICKVPFDTSGRILGIFNYKGQVTAILRSARLCSASYENSAEKLTVLVLLYDNKQFALIVDSVGAEQSENEAVLDTKTLYLGEF